ncbi:MAG: CHAT domain-containing protein [Saprospiraceae bacterium]|nr:CHAT domain-containing protein [Saprospiraceae bacterium]
MKRTGFLLLIFLWILPKDHFSQNTDLVPKIDTLEAINILSKANTLFDSNNFAKSSELAEIAYQFFQKRDSKSSPDLAEAAYQLGRSTYRLKNYIRAKDLLVEAITIWDKYYPTYELKKAKALYYMAYTAFHTGKIREAIDYSKNALSIQNSNFANYSDIIKSYLLVAQLYNDYVSFKLAATYYEQAFELIKPEFGIEDKYCISVLTLLAKNYKNQGMYLPSISLNEQAIWYLERGKSQKDNKTTECLLNIGEAYQSLNKIELALSYYQKGLAFSLKLNPIDSIMVSYCYSRISDAFYTLGDFKNNILTCHQQLEMMSGFKKDERYRYTCINLGKAYFNNKEYSLAQSWFEKAIAIIGTPLNSPDSSALASTQLYIGRVKRALKEYSSSETILNSSKNIIRTLYGIEYDGLYTVEEDLGDLYASYFIKTSDMSYLVKSSNHYDSAALRIQKKLINKKDATEIRKFLKDAVSIFEKCISSHLKLNLQKHHDSILINHIWELNEFLHSYLLYYQFKENNAMNNSGIPADLLSKDSMYRSEITRLEKHRNDLLDNDKFSITDTSILKLNSTIFKNKLQRQELITNLENSYPDYLNKKFDHKIVTIPQVKTLLNSNQTLLEYFCGDSSVFVFIIQNSVVKIKEIKLDFPIINSITNLNKSIYTFHTSKIRTEKMYKEQLNKYIESARYLYNLLLLPIAEYLTPELIIIPDAVLGNLPFDALLSSRPKDPTNFKTFPFVINQYSIQYSFSSGMLLEMSRVNPNTRNTKEFLGFAPFFDKNILGPNDVIQNEMAIRYDLTNLPDSGEEIIRAKNKFPDQSMIFTGHDATKQKFEQLSNNYKIIHLATHGKANYNDGNFSFIAFSSQDSLEKYALLSVAELYNLKLNSEMVILSACETANGERHRGEGIVSIASAFAHAGAKSIVASLWKVNDKSTMQIMDLFYTELKIGKQKHIALAQSKRNYLKNHPGQASHPFFWAGFISIGNMETILN